MAESTHLASQCSCSACDNRSGRAVDADGAIRPLCDTGFRLGDFNLADWFEWRITEVSA
jgi:hypothetical protein